MSMKTKIHTKKYRIIFDVDSTSVGGSVVEYGYNSKKECILIQDVFTVRQDATEGRQYDFTDYWARILKTFTSVAEAVHMHALVSIDAIYVNLSTPWMSSQKRIVHHKQKESFVITQELVDSIIKKEVDTPLSQNLDYYNHHVSLFDRQSIDYYVNGYPVRKYLGTQGTHLEIHSLTSVIADQTKEAFDHVIERAFHRQPIYIANSAVAYKTCFKKLPHQNNSILVDMSGEITDILILKNDHLEHISSIPVGIHHITRHIADKLSIPLVKARAYIDMITQDRIDLEHKKELLPVFKAGFEIWLASFYDALDQMSRQGLLPNTLILSAPDDVIDWVEFNILSRDELSEHLHARAKPQIIRLPDGSHGMSDSEMGTLAEYIKNNPSSKKSQ